MGSRLALIFTMLFTGEIIFGQTQSFTCEISFGPVIYPFYNYKNNENNGSYKAGGNLTYFISERAGFVSLRPPASCSLIFSRLALAIKTGIYEKSGKETTTGENVFVY